MMPLPEEENRIGFGLTYTIFLENNLFFQDQCLKL